jgi:ubiquinone/menaquinone biosynthesis C-methylase UbiE
MMVQVILENRASASSMTVKFQQFAKETLRRTDELYLYGAMVETARCVSSLSNSGKNKSVLDIGYNEGRSTVWIMLATGAKVVHAVDVTRRNVPSLKHIVRKVEPAAEVRPILASVSSLPYRDNTFDVVFCRSVLQYVEMEQAILEIRRVLKPEGSGLIVANMAGNPFVNFYRRVTNKRHSIPYGRIRAYLSYRMLRNWEQEGWCVSHKVYHILSPLYFPIFNLIPFALVRQVSYSIAEAADSAIKKLFPFLERLAWLAFIEIRK